MSRCKSCRAEIEWAKSTNNRSIPLDVASGQAGLFDKPPTEAPDLRGKLILENGVARPATEEDVRLGRPLRVSHFSTCPHSREWRGHGGGT